jgi:hypothetical protein
LLLIKGVTGAMYNGGGETNGAAPKRFGFNPFQAQSYNFGLKDVFTPFSDGKININTADANVLQLIPGVDQATAESIIKTRGGPNGDNSTPFMSVGDVGRAGINPEATQNIGTYCDVRSHTFEVDVTAHYATLTRDYVAIVWRNTPMDIEVVGFSWEKPHNGPSIQITPPGQ